MAHKPRYCRRVDICQYPMPAGLRVAEFLCVKREGDILIFETSADLLEFNRLVKLELELCL
jgi:hypothetical protein